MTQQERTAKTREKILAAAMEEFGTHGYEGGSMAGICGHGISRGLIYHNFRNKEALYLACMKKSCQNLVGRLEELLQEEQDNAQALVTSVLEIRSVFADQCPMENRILFEGLLTPPSGLQHDIRTILEPLEQSNNALLARAIDRVRLRPDVSKEEAVEFFSMIQYSYNNFFRSEKMRNHSLEERIIAHEQKIPRILEFLLYGIAEKKSALQKEETGSVENGD